MIAAHQFDGTARAPEAGIRRLGIVQEGTIPRLKARSALVVMV